MEIIREDKNPFIANWDIKQRQSAIAIIGRLVRNQDEIDWNNKIKEYFE